MKYNTDYCLYWDKCVTSGRKVGFPLGDGYTEDLALITPSRHFTFLFNAFVMLQFFNFLNARKI